MIRQRSKNEQFMPFLNLGVSIILILKVIRSSFFLLISFIYSIISGYIIPLSPVKSWLGIPNSSLSEEILGYSHCFLSLLLLVLEFYIILYRTGPDSGRNLMEEPGQLKRVVIDALAGAISGAISRTVTSPLDVIKIRFQVQLEPTSWILLRKDMYKPSKYTGIMQASKDIFREEGLPGFWRGNVPALLMYMHYTAIQFTVLHKIKTVASGSSKTDDHLRLSPYLSYVSGAAAGCAATVGSYPLDLLRTILASQGEPKIYPNMRSAFVNIIQTRGIRGLYAGLSPTLVEIIPYAGLQFGTYDTFKRWMMTWNKFRLFNVSSPNNGDSLSSFQLFLCGFAAGTSAKAICHPLDVVKKRFQVEGLQRDLKYGARVEKSTYKNMYDALRQILLTEGWAGLYKGIYPSLIKSAPAAAVTFVAYEYISDYLESLIT